MTNVSVQMSHDFSKIMQQLLKEANGGMLATKGEAIKRKDQLLGGTTAPAVPTDEAAPPEPAVPAEDSAPAECEYEENGQLPVYSQDVD